MDKKTILKAKELIKLTNNHICNYCLGRKFSGIIEAKDNFERGVAIINELNAENQDNNYNINNTINDLNNTECQVCRNIIENLDTNLIISKIKEKVSYLSLEFDSFVLGSKLPKEIVECDEKLSADIDVESENIKKEINRIIGEILEDDLRAKVDFEDPDIIILVDLRGFFKEKEISGKNNFEDVNIRIQINPIFIEGRYLKFKRGIPQTKWPCGKCKGKGCDECNFTGKQYAESVEELISEIVLKHTGGRSTKFHGAGREDIDVRMLGTGRPFVLEIKEPKIRKLDLDKIAIETNEHSKGKTEYIDLKYTIKSRKGEIKVSSPDTYKVYNALVKCDTEIANLELDKLQSLKVIEQRTPNRVSHRRADLVRIKEVKDIKIANVDNDQFEMIIKTQGGLYIKELISGDEGRSNPNVSDVLGTKAYCAQLDVIEVGIK
ncbi:tRNA pseudouridine(54/55) synthase Pus10 [Methanobrevibacter filiformis]|uniref:tRNA pseudouridine synthase Pus10 n=1 Tax=Methanobrevibacter filiformis TaxID=55758 RepID=A0A166F9Q6_9EURY|nr:tRNA pseudouridine(54/55) synthase Pus10 [Methanobrevibacter filiformis]KZX17445.1 THUMP domain protein [Methanobrevibacter filiformis]